MKATIIQNTGIEWQRKLRTPAVPTRMLNKKQALKILGISPTNEIKNHIFTKLPKYDNPFSTQAIFREEDVIDLLRSFPVVHQDS